MARIVCLGELLIDFIPSQEGAPMEEVRGFIKSPGGAPANVAVGLARLGIDASFLGKVGDDPFGHYLANVLKTNHVDTTYLTFAKEAQTSLAFVGLGRDGERSFLFYRNPGADTLLAPSEIPREIFLQAQCLHFGSLSLIREPSRSATREAVRIAKENGVIVSFDPNIRPALWPSHKEMEEQIEWSFGEAAILKMSEEDLSSLVGGKDFEDGIRWITKRFDPPLLVMTLGKEGCLGIHAGEREFVKGISVHSVDTTGAGDAFTAGLLWALFHGPGREKVFSFSDLTSTRLSQALRFANACGAITTTKKGAIPALPRRGTVVRLLKGMG